MYMEMSVAKNQASTVLPLQSITWVCFFFKKGRALLSATACILFLRIATNWAIGFLGFRVIVFVLNRIRFGMAFSIPAVRHFYSRSPHEKSWEPYLLFGTFTCIIIFLSKSIIR